MIKVVDERGDIYWVSRKALRPVPFPSEIEEDESAILGISETVFNLSAQAKGKPKYKPGYKPPKPGYKPPKPRKAPKKKSSKKK